MPIRVLVVDDSAFMRRVLCDTITAEPDMELAGVATNGLEALVKVEQLLPDVVTLDVEMPEMDGLTALRHLMRRYPRPVVMLSSRTQAGAVTTLRALSIGAIDFVAKPSGAIVLDFQLIRNELVQKIRVAARAKVRFTTTEARPPQALLGSSAAAGGPATRGLSPDQRFDRLVVIGASTGGPRALGTLIPALRPDGHTAYLIVQHMPAGFTRSLAERLDSLSHLSVREAAPGDHFAADLALVAPGDSHLRVGPSGTVQLDDGPRVHGVRPAVDVTLGSAVERLGKRVVTAILTGMGQDGATGAVAVHAAGGIVLAEDESTCVVWGMPRAVCERGVADRVIPLGEMAEALMAAVAVKSAAMR